MQLRLFKEDARSRLILQTIHLYFNDGQFLMPNTLSINGWVPSKDTTIKELIEQLTNNGIYLEKDEKHTLENIQIGYKSNANVVIIFSLDEGMGKLVSMYR